MPAMNPALVLYAHDLATTRDFYEALGLAFAEEKHEIGPVHFACDFGGFVLELYPLKDGASPPRPCQSTALILPVTGFDDMLKRLRTMDMKLGTVSAYDAARGLRAVSVRDPDGRLVRLLERDPRDCQ
jgi:hypothetical protein